MHLIIDQGYGVAQAAKAMKVGLSTLQRWLRQYRQETKGVTPEARTITPEQLRITILFHGALAGHLLVKLYDKARHAKRMLI